MNLVILKNASGHSFLIKPIHFFYMYCFLRYMSPQCSDSIQNFTVRTKIHIPFNIRPTFLYHVHVIITKVRTEVMFYSWFYLLIMRYAFLNNYTWISNNLNIQMQKFFFCFLLFWFISFFWKNCGKNQLLLRKKI